jgi:hypothetical protein
MARMPILMVFAAFAVVGCGHGKAGNGIDQAVDESRRQSEQQAGADPTRQPHSGDSNPLRRKLGDLQIRELFFGPTQTQGDWMAYLPCSQSYFGLPVAGPNRIYLKRCPALEQYLLDRAHRNGFPEATTRDVLDTRISGAQTSTP